MLKISLPFKKFTTSRVNNSKIPWIENAKFSGYCFYTSIKTSEIIKSVPINVIHVKESTI